MTLCPTCRARMLELPACPYPLRLCPLCGTCIHGSEEDQQTLVPTLVSLMHDFAGECLRDDRERCAVYLAARDAAAMVPQKIAGGVPDVD